MFKKIALSMLAIALVAALVGASTMALFRDNASNDDNVFAAGTVSITLNPGGPGGVFGAPGIQIGPLAPGDSGAGQITVTNAGNLDIFMALDPSVAACSGILCEVLQFTVSQSGVNAAGQVYDMAPGASLTFDVAYSLPLDVGNPGAYVADPDGTRYMGAQAEYTAAFKAVQKRNNDNGAGAPLTW